MELKPCPVCGATKGLYVLEDYHEFEWYVFCDNCKTSLCNENAQTKEDAIKHWNTRYDKVCHADDVRYRTCKYSVNRGWHDGICRNVHEPPIDSTFWPTPHFKCSMCGTKHVSMNYVHYCPNCGAKVIE